MRTTVSEKSGQPLNVRAVSRALSILTSFEPERPNLSLSDLVKLTGLDKGTARRLLLTLAHHGFVSFDVAKQKYTLGPIILKLAAAVTHNKDLRDLIRPILVKLGDETKATAHWAIEEGDEAVCVERYQPEQAAVLFPHWNVGAGTTLNTGSAPLLLLSAMPDEGIEAMLTDPARRSKLAKPIRKREIRRKVAEIRERGWALSVDELAPGLTALSAPVFGADGGIVAAISLVGLTPQMMHGGDPVYLQRVLAATRTASNLLRII